jgi:hypothetical protein
MKRRQSADKTAIKPMRALSNSITMPPPASGLQRIQSGIRAS